MKSEHVAMVAMVALAVAVYALASRPSGQVAQASPADKSIWDGFVEWWM